MSRKRKAAAAVLLISIPLLVVSYFLKDRLPPVESVAPDVYAEPSQTPVEKAPFEVEVGDNLYMVEPLYRYELSGLVVSYNDSSSWLDISHSNWKDFLNIKDICVLWGDNVARELYSEMKFSSGDWMCNYWWYDGATGRLFRSDQFSNNHLLATDPAVAESIRDARIGDQIRLTGYLSRYSRPESGFTRGTSTTRIDTGNGACETIFVDSFEILRAPNALWRHAFIVSLFLIPLGAAIWFGSD